MKSESQVIDLKAPREPGGKQHPQNFTEEDGDAWCQRLVSMMRRKNSKWRPRNASRR